MLTKKIPKVRPSYDPICAIFSSFNFNNVSWCYIENDLKIERTEDRATRIITWTHFMLSDKKNLHTSEHFPIDLGYLASNWTNLSWRNDQKDGSLHGFPAVASLTYSALNAANSAQSCVLSDLVQYQLKTTYFEKQCSSSSFLLTRRSKMAMKY